MRKNEWDYFPTADASGKISAVWREATDEEQVHRDRFKAAIGAAEDGQLARVGCILGLDSQKFIAVMELVDNMCGDLSWRETIELAYDFATIYETPKLEKK